MQCSTCSDPPSASGREAPYYDPSRSSTHRPGRGVQRHRVRHGGRRRDPVLAQRQGVRRPRQLRPTAARSPSSPSWDLCTEEFITFGSEGEEKVRLAFECPEDQQARGQSPDPRPEESSCRTHSVATCPPGARHGRSRLVLAAYAWNASRSGRRPILRQPVGSRVSTTRQSSRHRWPRRAGTPPAPKQTTTGRGVLSGARSVLPRAMSSRCTSPRSSRLGSRDPFCLASGSRSSSSLLCSYPRSLSSDLPGADTNQCRRGVVRERGPRRRRTWSSSAGRESGDGEGSS